MKWMTTSHLVWPNDIARKQLLPKRNQNRKTFKSKTRRRIKGPMVHEMTNNAFCSTSRKQLSPQEVTIIIKHQNQRDREALFSL